MLWPVAYMIYIATTAYHGSRTTAISPPEICYRLPKSDAGPQRHSALGPAHFSSLTTLLKNWAAFPCAFLYSLPAKDHFLAPAYPCPINFFVWLLPAPSPLAPGIDLKRYDLPSAALEREPRNALETTHWGNGRVPIADV
jgi:hypothetical protein